MEILQFLSTNWKELSQVGFFIAVMFILWNQRGDSNNRSKQLEIESERVAMERETRQELKGYRVELNRNISTMSQGQRGLEAEFSAYRQMHAQELSLIRQTLEKNNDLEQKQTDAFVLASTDIKDNLALEIKAHDLAAQSYIKDSTQRESDILAGVVHLKDNLADTLSKNKEAIVEAVVNALKSEVSSLTEKIEQREQIIKTEQDFIRESKDALSSMKASLDILVQRQPAT